MRKLTEYITPDNLRRVAGFFAIVSLLIMYRGLSPSREIPFYPALQVFLDNQEMNIVSILLLLCTLIFVVIKPSRVSGAIVLAAGVLFVMIDLNRFHPLMLNVVIIMLLPSDANLETVRKNLIWLIMITYLFMALNRINPTYFVSFELLILWFKGGKDFIKPFTMIITALQGLVVISLVVFKSQKVGSILSVGLSLLFALWMTIVGIDSQSIVWNLFIAILSAVLVSLPVREQEELSLFQKLNYNAGSLLVFAIALLGYVGVINKSFSYCTYSGRAESGLVLVKPEKVAFLPSAFQKGIVYLDSNPIIDLNYMIGVSYGQTLFPQERNIRNMVHPLRNVSFENEDLVLLLRVGEDLEIGKGIKPFLKSEF